MKEDNSIDPKILKLIVMRVKRVKTIVLCRIESDWLFLIYHLINLIFCYWLADKKLNLLTNQISS